MTPECRNCAFARKNTSTELECRRYAPSSYNALLFHVAELVRDIAWNTRAIANIKEPEDKADELNQEATETTDFACWPTIDASDWCGEWKGGPEIKTETTL